MRRARARSAVVRNSTATLASARRPNAFSRGAMHETDMLFAQAIRAQLGVFHEHLQPQAARLPQDVQAALEQVARVVAHLSQVGHDAQRDEIEQPGRSLRPAGAAVEFLGQLVGDADAGERDGGRWTTDDGRRTTATLCSGRSLTEPRTSCPIQLGIDDRVRVRQDGRQVVVIGDDHVHAARPGIRGGLDRGNAGVAGEDQPRARVDDLRQDRHADAVTLGRSDRDMVRHAAAQIGQRRDQQRRGGLAVHVEVAPDADRLASTNCGFQPIGRGSQSGQRVGRGGRVRGGIEEGAGRGRRRHAAAGEGRRDQRVSADGRGQVGGDRDRRQAQARSGSSSERDLPDLLEVEARGPVGRRDLLRSSRVSVRLRPNLPLRRRGGTASGRRRRGSA